jgi:rhodanese-related sulfurtransferase
MPGALSLKALLLKALLIFLFLLGMAMNVMSETKNIDNEELQNLIDSGVPVIDVREEFEWIKTGIIEGSHLITFFDSAGNYDVTKWMLRLKEIATYSDPLILICRSGRRSGIVAEYLSENESYVTVYNVKNGITGWIKSLNKTKRM